MKFLAAFFCVFFSWFSASAQLEKGTWLLGGTGSFYSYSGSYTYMYPSAITLPSEYTDISVSGTVGYFVADKLALGLRPSFSSFKGVVLPPGAGTTNTKRYTIGPFGRYYILNMEKPLNLVADVSYQFGIIDTPTPPGQSGKISSFSFLAGPVFYFNSSAGLEFLLGYKRFAENLEETYSDKRKGFYISIGFQFHLTN